MPLRTSQLEDSTINLTSMIDVVMIIIFYFMLATQFRSEERQYDVKLPTVTDATALTGQPDEIVVNVAANGTITVRAVTVKLSDLEPMMRLAADKFAGQAVIIRGDGQGTYQNIMDVMSACRRGGIKNLSLAHRPQGGSE